MALSMGLQPADVGMAQMNTDIETRTERNIESAVRHARKSNQHLFVAGYQAAKVYGSYEQAATAEIATRAGRSVSTVQSWVDAYRCFIACYEIDRTLAKALRRSLTMTHFKRMYDAAVKYKMEADQQLYFLSLMMANKANGENYGPDELTREIEVAARYAGLEPDKAVDWRWHFTRMEKPLQTLLSFDGKLPEPVRRWANMGLAIGGEWRNS